MRKVYGAEHTVDGKWSKIIKERGGLGCSDDGICSHHIDTVNKVLTCILAGTCKGKICP